MTDPRRIIIALNNQGVRLLQQKNHLQANQVLLQCLHKLKETRIRQRVVPSGVVPYEKLVEGDDEDRPSCFATVPLNLDTTTTTTSSSTCSLTIFDRVFVFLPAGPAEDPTARHNRDGSAAVILYNLALTQQTRALQIVNVDTTKSQAALLQALRMYAWALSALQHWDRHSTTVHQGCHLLRVATLHNMAVAQALVGQTTAARRSFQCLETVLHQQQAKPYLERRDAHFFFVVAATTNVLWCQQQQQQKQPAEEDDDSTPGLTRTTSSLLGPAPAAAA